MDLQHSMTGFTWGFAITFTLLTLALVAQEIHRLVIKKQDRGFWAGAFYLLALYLGGDLARTGWDHVEQHHFRSMEGQVAYGYLGKEALKAAFPNHDKPYCEINDTPESEQCVFLMRFNSGEEAKMQFVATQTETYLRYGQWPLSHTMAFPPLQEPETERSP